MFRDPKSSLGNGDNFVGAEEDDYDALMKQIRAGGDKPTDKNHIAEGIAKNHQH